MINNELRDFLKEKNEKFNKSANIKLNELLEKRSHEKNEEYTLEKGIVLEVNNLTMQFGGLKLLSMTLFCALGLWLK